MDDLDPMAAGSSLDDVLDEALAAAFALPPVPAVQAEAGVPASLGRYRIVGVLGEGGMGVVYDAIEPHPERAIALKVIRSHLSSPAASARFEREAALLARLEHPGIARVHAAGTLEQDGALIPYMAMERVDGRRLDRWIAEENPSRRRRIEVVAELADAVQHAHQRGVVHRDLKPGNVLVDASGQPRLVDFGIARAVDADEATHATMAGQVLGTLPYMSPEQLRGDVDAIDTRTDVYALGAVLLNALTGETPYDVTGQSPASAALTVAQNEPRRLRALDPSLKGDLDAICAMALETEPERRYASAGALAEDLRRHLADEPVTARPATALYQLAKIVRRHRLATAAGAALVLLVTGAGYVNAAILEGKNEEIEASRAEAEGINDFILEEILFAARPDRSKGETLTVRDAVERAREAIGSAEVAPMVEAAVREALGETLFKLGDLNESVDELRAAFRIAKAERGPDDPRALSAMERLARVLGEVDVDGRAESMELAKELLERRTRLLGPEAPLTLRADYIIASLLRDAGENEAAEQGFRRILEIRERVLGPEDEGTLNAMGSIGEMHQVTGRFEESIEILSRLLEIELEVYGRMHPETLATMNNLGNAYADLGRLQEAHDTYREALAISETLRGADHIDGTFLLNNLSWALNKMGRPEEAVPYARRALTIRASVYGPKSARTLMAMHNLGTLMLRLDDTEEARQLVKDAFEGRLEVLGPTHSDTVTSYIHMVSITKKAEGPAAAEAAGRGFLEQLDAPGQTRHWTRSFLVLEIAHAVADQGRPEEAVEMLEATRVDLVERLGETSPYVARIDQAIEETRGR